MKSIININFSISNEMGMIALYGDDTSQTIYIEEKDEPRQLVQFSIQFESGQLGVAMWEKQIITSMKDMIIAVDKSKHLAKISKEIPLTTAEISLFQATLQIQPDQVLFKGEEERVINAAFQSINVETPFTIENPSSACGIM